MESVSLVAYICSISEIFSFGELGIWYYCYYQYHREMYTEACITAKNKFIFIFHKKALEMIPIPFMGIYSSDLLWGTTTYGIFLFCAPLLSPGAQTNSMADELPWRDELRLTWLNTVFQVGNAMKTITGRVCACHYLVSEY